MKSREDLLTGVFIRSRTDLVLLPLLMTRNLQEWNPNLIVLSVANRLSGLW